MSEDAAGVLLPGFVGTALPDWLAARLRNGLAGVCLFGENIVSPEQLRALTAEIRAANPRAIVAVDEEGGDVTRLYERTGSPFPGNAVLGRIDDVEYTESVARSVGRQLRLAGCNLDFAPDVDVNSNPKNPVIGVRSFGADAALVARHAAAWVRGLESTGTAASAKHFPGHGDTAQDSHLATPVVDRPLEALRERELVPFAAAIAAGARTIMTSHILLPRVDRERPATFSRRILQDLLRGELGFDGVIVSDALDMAGASGGIGIPEAAVRAVAGGCDLLCLGTANTDAQLGEIEAVLDGAVSDGRLEAARLADAALRTRRLGVQLRDDQESIPPEAYESPAASFDRERTIGVFEIGGAVAVGGGRVLLTLETTTNIAVGPSPWGPAAAGAEVVRVRRGDRIEIPDGLQPVLIGKDNHRHEWVRALIDELRREHPETIVVDMGWPDDDRAYADVATFGASRHVGEALTVWLDRAGQSSQQKADAP